MRHAYKNRMKTGWMIALGIAGAIGAVAAIGLPVTAARADGSNPWGIKLPAPVSILNNAEIVKVPPQPVAKVLPPGVGPVGPDVAPQPPAAARPRPVLVTDDFDPSVYAVYGIMIGPSGVSAIIGPVGGDSQVYHIGEMIDTANVRLEQIHADYVVVRTSSGSMRRIGFYGGAATLAVE